MFQVTLLVPVENHCIGGLQLNQPGLTVVRVGCQNCIGQSTATRVFIAAGGVPWGNRLVRRSGGDKCAGTGGCGKDCASSDNGEHFAAGKGHDVLLCSSTSYYIVRYRTKSTQPMFFFNE